MPSLVLARANGAKVKMVAVNYEKAPYAIFSLNPGANVTDGQATGRPKLGSGAGSFTPKVIAGFMTQHGLDPKKLTISKCRAAGARDDAAVRPSAGDRILRHVEARPGGRRQGKRAELRTFLLADHGLKLYSNGIVATEDYLGQERRRREALRARKPAGLAVRVAQPEKAAEDQIKVRAESQSGKPAWPKSASSKIWPLRPPRRRTALAGSILPR